ncbi:MAG TPA: hypothetical protein VKA46_38320 [Gemmataceae bacterium]|nr:hypothetical protein [Gemmataceae bacterium]
MDPQPDVIRQQIEETRSSLTEKLETLEAEVKGTVETAKQTVESAKEAVEETLSTAKETVQETITSVKETVEQARETVRRTFDLPYQVDRHPWGMLGLSLVSGVVVGALLGGRLNSGRRLARRMSEMSAEPHRADEHGPAAAAPRPTHEESVRPGFTDKLTSQLGDEFEKAKDLAITALVGVVGDIARKAIPALAATVEDMMTRAASEYGAPPQQHGEECFRSAAGSSSRTPPMY